MLLLLNALREGRLGAGEWGGKQDVSIDKSVQIIAGSNQGRSTSTISRFLITRVAALQLDVARRSTTDHARETIPLTFLIVT